MPNALDALPKPKFDLTGRECKLLCEEFGEKNVETAMICVAQQCDPTGLRVLIPPTYEMVRDILEAMHKRLDVGEVRICGEEIFYHHPDGAGNPIPLPDWPEEAVMCDRCNIRAVVNLDGDMTCLHCNKIGLVTSIEEPEKK